MPIDPLDVVTLAVLAFFGTRLALSFRVAIRHGARRRSSAIVRGLRVRHFAPVPFVVAAVFAAANLLVELPLLGYGWWSAIGGTGNPVFGVTESTSGTALELLVPAAFLVLLVPALPLLVEREEELFRLGAESWSPAKRTVRAAFFGLVHAAVGIPVGVALALGIGGAWFTWSYLSGYRRSGGSRAAALLESTRAHLAYNATIVVAVVISLALAAVS